MKNILQEFINSKLNIISEEKLGYYIEFCLQNNLKEKQLGVSYHHILPIGIFEQFQNLTDNPWNGSYLTYENHYIAHSILAEAINHSSIIGAWWGMNNKDKITKGICGLEIIGAERYSELITKASEDSSRRNSNIVVCRLKSNPDKSIRVPLVEFKNNRNLYLGNTEGRLCVLDIASNEKIMIDKDDYNKEIHLFHKTGIKRKQSSIDKERETRKIIGSDGLNITQRAAIKGWKKLKETLSETELKELNSKRASHKENHPLALKIFIYNSNNEIMFECNGNIKDIIRDNNLPKTLINSYRKNSKIGATPKSVTRMKNKGQEEFIGWYAKIK